MSFEPENERSQFPSTHWSSVLAAGGPGGEEGLKVLGNLLKRYQAALVGYIRRKFLCKEEEAADLFQEFVLQIVLKKELIRQAQPTKGYQFRKFLLSSLHKFAISEYRRRNAKKRAPVSGLSSLDEISENHQEIAADDTGDEFDVAWARAILGEALTRMKEECEQTSRSEVWGVFDHRLRRPILDGAEVLPYEELVERYHFTSPAQAHNVLVTAKRMFARHLRLVISEYVADESATEVELRELQLILSHCR